MSHSGNQHNVFWVLWYSGLSAVTGLLLILKTDLPCNSASKWMPKISIGPTPTLSSWLLPCLLLPKRKLSLICFVYNHVYKVFFYAIMSKLQKKKQNIVFIQSIFWSLPIYICSLSGLYTWRNLLLKIFWIQK